MSNFPLDFDNDITLPFVNDNLTEIGGEAINAARDAIINMEFEIGLGASGTTGSIANRLAVALNPDGSIKSSAITGLGLVTLPITQDQIANNAAIPESKLKLDHRTQDLFNYIRDLSKDINLSVGWISVSGVKLEPHLIGAIYRHSMDQIDVTHDLSNYPYLENKFRLLRDNLQSYNLVSDINDELLAHQWADGSPAVLPTPIFTNNGSQYPATYAHTASGIFINTDRFSTIPQTAEDLQAFAEYIDNASIFLLGTRIQNLYTSGISRISRAANLSVDGYGQALVPPTPVITYLKNLDNSSSPYDDIDTGDDIIEFKPSTVDSLNNSFDSKFALVRPGDIIRVNYGSLEVPFVIKEKKYNQNSGNKKYAVRIVGKNLQYSTGATARIDKPLFNKDKYGVLAVAAANNNFLETPSLIVSSPRGGEVLGVGFNAAQFDSTHYQLYLVLYPTGHAADGYTILPGIDVTGNKGTTPGLYTLDSIVEATNNAFRQSGYNYRFIAFSYQGEFGLTLADSYGNAAFSIINGVQNGDGTFNQAATELTFPNNVVDLFPSAGLIAPDPLGFGYYGSAVASPPYMAAYASAEASLNPTKLFIPLTRKNFYVNGIEKDRLSLEVGQALDGYGDGYWVGEIFAQQIFPGPVPAGRVQTTYRIPLDLSTSNLKPGKTVVVQTIDSGGLVDSGRFIIQAVSFGCTPTLYTDITVYDSVHAKGFSPTTTLGLGAEVKIYFNSDSVSFNSESATDFSAVSPFKRHFEVYVDQNSQTFTHERGRFNISGTTQVVNNVNLYGDALISKLDVVRISPKLRGYQFGSVNKITLNITSYSSTDGTFTGYLASYDGVTFTNPGPTTLGKKGEVVRFYDETTIDYIDIIFDINENITSFTDQKLDFQLFPTLSLDDEILLLSTCQLNDSTQLVNRLVDQRQFGNTSEKDLTTSVFNYFAAPERLLHTNGVVRGFDIKSVDANIIKLNGGTVLVNGKLINVNHDTISVPLIAEEYNFTYYDVNWALCVNDKGELELIPLLNTDSSLNIPNNPTRLFVAKDAVGGGNYNITATTFAELYNSRTDLTLLYIVFAAMSPALNTASITLTTTDTRKFVYKKDWEIIPTVTANIEHGDFRNLTSLVKWLKYYSTYTNTAIIKGSFSSVPSPLSFTNRVKLIGDGTSIFNTNTSLAVTNVEFNYIDFALTQSLSLTNSIVNDSVLTGSGTLTISSVTLNRFTSSTSNTISVTNSTINSATFTSPGSFTATGSTLNDTVITTSSALSFTGSTLNNVTFNLQSASSVSFSNCVVNNCKFNYNAGATITFTGTASATGIDSTLRNSTFEFGSSLSSALNLTGLVQGNKFHWSAASGAIALTGIFNVIDNKFYAESTAALTTQFISVADTSNGTIAQNIFHKNTNSLAAYILAPATYTSGVVNVTDNFFDSSTVNGTDQNLVKNLPLTWVYKDNSNTPATVNVRRITTSGTYNVTVEDHVIAVNLSGSLTINLPDISLSPPGRTLIIKDANGKADSFNITLHRSNVVTEAIENLYQDYVYKVPYGSITLVASIDPNGGNNGSGLTPKYMWIIV